MKCPSEIKSKIDQKNSIQKCLLLGRKRLKFRPTFRKFFYIKKFANQRLELFKEIKMMKLIKIWELKIILLPFKASIFSIIIKMVDDFLRGIFRSRAFGFENARSFNSWFSYFARQFINTRLKICTWKSPLSALTIYNRAYEQENVRLKFLMILAAALNNIHRHRTQITPLAEKERIERERYQCWSKRSLEPQKAQVKFSAVYSGGREVQLSIYGTYISIYMVDK